MYGLDNAYIYGNIYLKDLLTRVVDTFWPGVTIALYTIYSCMQNIVGKI